MGFSANGLRSLMDGWFRFYQPGLTCWLRIQTVDPESEDYAQLGFVPTVTGALSGFEDVLIRPPADVRDISLHNIGLNSAKLRFGAREFLISHSFVRNRMIQMNYTDAMKVWNDDSVMGLYYDGRLFSIESVTHEDFGGEPVLWRILANASEVASPEE